MTGKQFGPQVPPVPVPVEYWREDDGFCTARITDFPAVVICAPDEDALKTFLLALFEQIRSTEITRLQTSAHEALHIFDFDMQEIGGVLCAQMEGHHGAALVVDQGGHDALAQWMCDLIKLVKSAVNQYLARAEAQTRLN